MSSSTPPSLIVPKTAEAILEWLADNNAMVQHTTGSCALRRRIVWVRVEVMCEGRYVPHTGEGATLLEAVAQCISRLPRGKKV